MSKSEIQEKIRAIFKSWKGLNPETRKLLKSLGLDYTEKQVLELLEGCVCVPQQKCSACGLREECPVWCGFCKVGFVKVGKCSVCKKDNVPVGKHGNMKTGYWVCKDCTVSCMY